MENETKAQMSALIKSIPDSTQAYFLVKKWENETNAWRNAGRIDAFPDVDMVDELRQWGAGRYKLQLFDQDDRKITQLAGQKIQTVVVRVDDDQVDDGQDDATAQVQYQEQPTMIGLRRGGVQFADPAPIDDDQDIYDQMASDERKAIRVLQLQNLRQRLLAERDGVSPKEEQYQELTQKIEELNQKINQAGNGQQQQGDALKYMAQSAGDSQSNMMQFFAMLQQQSQQQQQVLLEVLKQKPDNSNKDDKLLALMINQQQAQQQQMVAMLQAVRPTPPPDNTPMLTLLASFQQQQQQQAQHQAELLVQLQQAQQQQNDKWTAMLLQQQERLAQKGDSVNIVKEIMAMPVAATIAEKLLNPQQSVLEKALPNVIENVTSTVTNITSRLAQQLMDDRPPDDPSLKKANAALHFLRAATPEISKIVAGIKTARDAKEKQQEEKPAESQPSKRAKALPAPVTQQPLQTSESDMLQLMVEIEALPVNDAVAKIRSRPEVVSAIEQMKNDPIVASQVKLLVSPKVQQVLAQFGVK